MSTMTYKDYAARGLFGGQYRWAVRGTVYGSIKIYWAVRGTVYGSIKIYCLQNCLSGAVYHVTSRGQVVPACSCLDPFLADRHR